MVRLLDEMVVMKRYAYRKSEKSGTRFWACRIGVSEAIMFLVVGESRDGEWEPIPSNDMFQSTSPDAGERLHIRPFEAA